MPVSDQKSYSAAAPFARIYILLLLIGLVVSAALYWGITFAQGLAPLPRNFDEKTSAARLDALRTALIVVGGAAAVAGLYVGYRKQRNDERSHDREQDKIFNDRLFAIAGMLDEETPGVRQLGLTALARLADDSPRDRSTCLRHLCAYLRRPVETITNDLSERANWRDPGEWEARRSAAWLLAERLKSDLVSRWDQAIDLRDAVLIDAPLDRCTFDQEVDLSNVIILGSTTLAESDFRSSVSWAGAEIFDDLNIDNTKFSQGYIFDGAIFHEPLELPWHLDIRLSLQSAVFLQGLVINPQITVARAPRRAGQPEYLRRRLDTNLTLIESIFGEETLSTTRRINLCEATLAGLVKIPEQVTDLTGADLSQVEHLDLVDANEYCEWKVWSELISDSNTVWPPVDAVHRRKEHNQD